MEKDANFGFEAEEGEFGIVREGISAVEIEETAIDILNLPQLFLTVLILCLLSLSLELSKHLLFIIFYF